MIRALFLLIVSLFSLTAFAQKPFKYAGRGIQMTEMWADSVAKIPSDTLRNKTGIARIGSRFFVGNGVSWLEIAGGSSPIDTANKWVNRFFRIPGRDSFYFQIGNTVYAVKDSVGGSTQIDTTSLSTRINLKLDSITRIQTGCQSIQKYWINGTGYVFDTVYKPNGIIDSGLVTRISDTVFRISSSKYSILCTTYNSSATTLTLNGNSTNSLPRADLIGVDNTGNPFIQQGVNAANPLTPTAVYGHQIGIASVYFPALSDSGIVNIYYPTTYVNGIDSTAYVSFFVASDSSYFGACDRRGRCDTIFTSAGIDSIRRLPGSTTVSARKNGSWIAQYIDSVGSGSGGGGSQNLDQVLTVGNNTDTTINFVDTLSSNEGKQFVTIYPKGYGQTGYPNGRPAMFSGLGYQRYPGVNADGRPNVVGLLWGYNGGFNTKVIASEPTWGVRTETWYQISGAGNSEFHGVSPEFQPINGTASRRLGTWYVRNSDGYSTFISQGDQWQFYRGASDTVLFGLGASQMTFGSKGVGSFSIKNTDSASNFTTYALSLNGATFSNTVATGAQPLNKFTFTSPITVSPGTSYGSSSTYLGLVNTTVAVANKYGFSVISSGITTTNFGGLTIDGNTTGTITPLYGRNTSATGTVSSVMIGGNGSTAAWMLRDNSIGIDWRMYLKSGDADRQLKIGFGTSTYDSLMKFRGTDGSVQIRTNLNVGSTDYAPASAAMSVTSTTQGFLPPRMTAKQAGLISSPAEGLLVYVTDTNGTFTAKGWWGWDGAAWQKLNN